MQGTDTNFTKKDTRPTVISMNSVAVRYGRGEIILSDINFHIEEKQFFFLTGPSGAGKTTLIKLIYNMHKPCSGQIKLFNKNIHGLSREELANLRRKMGIVFQGYCLINSMTVFENIALPLRIIHVPDSEITRRVNKIIDWVGLIKFANAYPKTLSGGQQQKVAVARAIINNPKILIADEPTGNLDDDSAKKLMKLFVDLNEKLGTTIILATHSKKLMTEYNYPIIWVKDKKVTFRKPYCIENDFDLTKSTDDLSDIIQPNVDLQNIFKPNTTKAPDINSFFNDMMKKIEERNEKVSDILNKQNNKGE